MSEDMAVTDKPASKEVNSNGDEASLASSANVIEPNSESSSQTTQVKIDPGTSQASGDTSIEKSEDNHARKRRASSAFSDDSKDFKGFDNGNNDDSAANYSQLLERMEADVSAASENLVPLRQVTVTPVALSRSNKRMRQDTGTDVSRPSSALSSRSEGDGVTSDAHASPASRHRKSTEMSSPLLRVPLEKGWKRELVYRAAIDSHNRRNADIYYYTPAGKKLRSTREVSEHLYGTGLNLENFSFFKEPLGVDDPEKEIIRDAKLMRRVESPIAAVPTPEKRTPKPKPPKGASPEHSATKSKPAKIKVKSLGSRLSNSATTPNTTTPKQQKSEKKPVTEKKTATEKKPANADNNNSSNWKKPSENKGKISNGGIASPATRRGRGRQKQDDVDHITNFFETAKKHNFNVVTQIFQYLGMRELAQCSRVCRLWKELTATPALWRHVRMKNSHVSDWRALCTLLLARGTSRLDLRKMLLPSVDGPFWDSFGENVPKVTSLERIEMCRCPSRAVEALCSLPQLTSLSATAIRDSRFDPSPLAKLEKLKELRLKSLAGLALQRDLAPLAALTDLRHLSLTSIKELGAAACETIGDLTQLETLELGECSFRAPFGTVLRGLRRLRRLRLERAPADCGAAGLLRALSRLEKLEQLELVNVDVKVGFDDALAECKNIQRLLIIPTYVSQSATTNKQVLSGVLRLKDSLTHLMWGVTIELLRVTELFIDQCDQAGDSKKKDIGECIPVLKPVPGCKLPEEHHVAGPPQVEILPLPTLQRLLAAQLPHTKLKLLRIPFHATWRQSLADFQ